MKTLCKLIALTFIVVFHNCSFASTLDISALNKTLSDLIPAQEPGCSIGVYEKGRALIKKGFGLANTELNVPMSDNNVHRMASVSKQFVAMAVHLLADQGKINLKDDIKAYVSGLPDYGKRVSIESIIGHVAGMGDYDMISSFGAPDGYVAPKGALNLKAVSGHPFRIGNEDYLSVAEFHALVKTLPLELEPNTEWRYSNMGYVMLAILVEEVSGLTLREFSDKHIFTPLGMSNTFFSDHPNEIVKNRAYGYVKNDNGEYENNMTNLFWVGDGGLHTTISDMQKWDAQFYNPKLGNNPKALMQTFMLANSSLKVNPSDGADKLYANGQVISNTDYGFRAAHSGGWLGAYIMYRRYPEKQFMNLVMCSNVSIDSTQIADAIDKWYFER